jgi:hypothetical protein
LKHLDQKGIACAASTCSALREFSDLLVCCVATCPCRVLPPQYIATRRRLEPFDQRATRGVPKINLDGKLVYVLTNPFPSTVPASHRFVHNLSDWVFCTNCRKDNYCGCPLSAYYWVHCKFCKRRYCPDCLRSEIMRGEPDDLRCADCAVIDLTGILVVT